MSTRLGACVRRARLQARLGRPIPTNTTSPSRSSRAATVAIISSSLYASEPVVHSGAELRAGFESGQLRLLLDVCGAIAHTVDELVEIPRQRAGFAGDCLPSDIEVVVAVVVSLCV